MFGKLTSAIGLTAGPLPPDHHAPARSTAHAALAHQLSAAHVPVSDTDCAACNLPCPSSPSSSSSSSGEGAGVVVEAYGGKEYEEYVGERYGEIEGLPKGFDTDWESDLFGSSKGGKGRIAVISTGKSDWEKDHTDEKGSLAQYLSKVIDSAPAIKAPKGPDPSLPYVTPSAFPPPSKPFSDPIAPPPSLYSSSLISQSDDPSDQSVLVFPDWKVVHEVEQSKAGAQELFDKVLNGELGRAGKSGTDDGGVGRKRSYVLPYRAVVLLCSHKKRDKRCHIAAPLLRSALHTCLQTHDIAVDDTGSSLINLDGPPLEEVEGGEEERELEVGRRIGEIEAVHGGEGGEVGIFNINHLGGHRYAGVMLIVFPSGAYISYGRVTPQEIPRVVEDTILQGKIVPGLLRNAVGVERDGKGAGGFLSW
ncbi:hypothetical protein B9479_006666 [Cryptococcus floricola]|uniref:Uncharacterized protein n=1 Tax=Cryptococcus floricola TaxID=2591691 RepID=A0A5D3API9_9TREE|nr:hypothetical protein B9479_006666 [Cryptococcus floricola]